MDIAYAALMASGIRVVRSGSSLFFGELDNELSAARNGGAQHLFTSAKPQPYGIPSSQRQCELPILHAPLKMSVTLHTNLGDIKIEVFCESVPKTAEVSSIL